MSLKNNQTLQGVGGQPSSGSSSLSTDPLTPLSHPGAGAGAGAGRELAGESREACPGRAQLCSWGLGWAGGWGGQRSSGACAQVGLQTWPLFSIGCCFGLDCPGGLSPAEHKCLLGWLGSPSLPSPKAVFTKQLPPPPGCPLATRRRTMMAVPTCPAWPFPHQPQPLHALRPMSMV